MRVLLLGLLLVALLARLHQVGALDQPRWWFAETTVLRVDRVLEAGRLGRHLLALFDRSGIDFLDESAVMMPVQVAFQAMLGPSFELPGIVGSAWGVLAVALAFLLGSSLHSPLFGLLFAGFVAASPLQITWSRLGGLQIGAPAHVLLVLWISHLAGRRRSLLLALLAGGCAWASLHQYYAARVALPLGALALLAGLAPVPTRKLRAAAVVAVYVAAMLGLQLTAHRSEPWQGLWPSYQGYVGTSGEKSLGELVQSAVATLREQAPATARAYFWERRTAPVRYEAGIWAPVPSGSALSLAPTSGGLCLLPVALLALVGCLCSLRHPRRDALWLALAVLGFLIPCLSRVSARRLLIFDLAVCAFASQGLLALLALRPIAGQSQRRAAAYAIGFVVALTVTSFATIRALDRDLPSPHWVAIPFGESGFGDGRVCMGCLEAGRRWQEAIDHGAFVVLFESNLDRENPTIPGGLPLYGKIAALAAGKKNSFLEFYSVMTNFEWEPAAGPLYDGSRSGYTAFLRERIEAEPHTSILWHFPQPTQWELALMDRLVAAGGTREPLPHGPVPQILLGRTSGPSGSVIRTPWEERAAALAVFEALEAAAPTPTSCLGVASIGSEPLDDQVLLLGSALEGEGSAEWPVGSWFTMRWRGREVSLPEAAVAIAVDRGNGAGERLRGLTRWAHDIVIDPATGQTTETVVPLPTPIGHDCGTLVGSDWWVVDPIDGRLSTSRKVEWPMPEGRWVGLAALGGDELLLAAADQSLHRLRTSDGRVLARLPASVPPSRRIHFGECTPVVAGAGWVGTFDALRSLLSVYDANGLPLSSVHFDRLLRLGRHSIQSIRGAGRDIGLANGTRVETFSLSVAPGCGTPE